LFIFFQAEDGIRYFHVTGVQTCALPICSQLPEIPGPVATLLSLPHPLFQYLGTAHFFLYKGFRLIQLTELPDWIQHLLGSQESRSEERRVGKECRWRW